MHHARTKLEEASLETRGRASGWVVLDQDMKLVSKVLCTAVVERHIPECILMSKIGPGEEIGQEADGMEYRRIGRGRIVEKDWLDACNIKAICCI